MVKHNNMIPDLHFHKDWQRRVKTWFDQAAAKKRRRLARKAKAVRIAPRPVAGPLRPVVHCPTIKYNARVRAGRGFTLEELKKAGINKREALGLGIAVDHRRTNKSVESLEANVARLKAYKARLVVFPRGRNTKPKAGDSSVEETGQAQQLAGPIMPITQEKMVPEVATITDDMRNFRAFMALRQARQDARLVGVRAKRAAEEAEKKKK
eukprot:CAMPEP_0196782502 /NCGR_PEP_ID=MMETSP1104-20130614/11501_1 /TAXON_ID=33652 /ORGANISM="Cafeteria sp., Strain Caron Lab Isolate" /LENGTH=208 /DNA_ID=CAMNT_0042152739 /DNA_START=49 /DNA_END=675 /DNA_ORIENTATION=-